MLADHDGTQSLLSDATGEQVYQAQPVLFQTTKEPSLWQSDMVYPRNFYNIIQPYTTEESDLHRAAAGFFKIKSGGATIIMNASLNATDATLVPELFYRHSMAMTAVYCVAYLLVFALGIVGNFFVIAVVFRSPRMRTVTNFFIVNLAIADILVIVFCLPATLMSNIFVRE
nr:unnamed protein product [Callosobruchus chinensis]